MTESDELTILGRAGKAVWLLMIAPRPMRTAELMQALGYKSYPGFWHLMNQLEQNPPPGTRIVRPERGVWGLEIDDEFDAGEFLGAQLVLESL